jgi:phosphoglycerol transferase MdoB-like AlkP superfamily enzyme
MARTQKPSGRAAPSKHRGAATGRYMSAEQTGRYTRPIPKDTRKSPRWFGPLVIGLLLFGAFLLVGNYLSFLPGAVSTWYLVAGFISIVAGFALSTKLR